MSKKSIPSIYFLVLAVVTGLIAAFVGVKFINNFVGAVPVVTVAVDKPQFSKIDQADLKVVQVSRSAVQKGMFAGVEPVVGQYTKTFIPAGTLLSKSMLADGKAVPDSTKEKGRANPIVNDNPLAVALTNLKEPGLRASTIPVDNIQGLGGNIVPGDKVDITGAMKLPLGLGAADQPVAKTIVRGRTVLATVKNQEQITGVTVALSPQEAQDINFALLHGRLSISLLPYEADQKSSDTQTTTAQTFIQKYINGTPPTVTATTTQVQVSRN